MTPSTIKLIHRMFNEAKSVEEIARASHKAEGLLLAWDQCPESYKDTRILLVRRALAATSRPDRKPVDGDESLSTTEGLRHELAISLVQDDTSPMAR